MTAHRPLVLVPGLTCDIAVWQHQIDALGSSCHIQVADHGDADSLAAMAERILAIAPRRFALAGHSMGGRVALEIVAREPGRVERLALLDTGFEGLASGEAGERERLGRNRLIDIARRQGMPAMAREWAQGMVHPDRREDAALMDEIHQMVCRATLDAVRGADPRAAAPAGPRGAAADDRGADAGALRPRGFLEPDRAP